jgi:predicted ATPase/DNA-binding SARP family transcriptional activator
VLSEGRPLTLAGKKQRAVLALLLLAANRVVPTESLIDALWEEKPPETAQKALQVYVSQLRKLLGRERLETSPAGYLLRVEEGELDLDRFQRLRAEGELVQALTLWRGSPLPEFTRWRFAQPEIVRLEELRLACVEDRLEADLASGNHAQLVGELEALVREHPLRQRLHGQLMLALYRTGRDAEALEVYRAARSELVEELGIEPRRELRELEQQILRQDPSLDILTEQARPQATRGVFVGRERELHELYETLDDAFAGHGRLVLVVGEPGIGKSRLAEEIVRQARARGAHALVGRCWEAGGAPAYWPWVESLRAYVRAAPAATLAAEVGSGASDLAQLLPELRERLDKLPEPGPLDPESARFRLFDAMREFLGRAAAGRPVVLVLDDLHAADTPSLLLLRYVARGLASMRVLLLAAFRDVDPLPGQPLAEMLAEVSREPTTRRLQLTGLTQADVAEYVGLTAAELASPALVEMLFAETEGNPLFVAETVRLLAVEGATASAVIPQSIRDVIARRLAHLSEECVRVLVLASVLGREFALAALARMAELSEVELLEQLDEAMLARVVSDLPGATSRLRFAHVLIRDTLYEGVTTARRIALHRLAVEALEHVNSKAGAHLAELAHHALAGSDFERALDYARAAGDRALALLAFEEAARLYATARDALELCRPDDVETRCELLLSLGEAQIRAGETPTAKATFLDAAALARRHALTRALGRAAAGYAGRIVFSRAGADDRVVPLLEEAIAGLGEADAELRSRLLARLAGALRDEHSRARRDLLSREAVDLARQAAPTALAYALAGRAHAITAPDTVDEMRTLSDEICETAARAGDLEELISGHMLRVMVSLWLGDLSAARADLTEAARIAEELGQPAQLWLVLGQQANLAIGTGEFVAADTLVAAALAAGEVAQPDTAIPHELMQRAALAEFRGGLDALEPELRALAAEHPARPVFRCAHIHLIARVGRLDEAGRELADLVRDGFTALPFDQEWLCATSFLADTAALVDNPEAAAELYGLLAPWGGFTVVDASESLRGSLQRDLGLLASVLERWDDAVAHFETALEANERMGLRPWLARTQENYAQMLQSRAAPGDLERAEELLTVARAAYRELGMDGAVGGHDHTV